MIALRFTGRRASCVRCRYSYRVTSGGKVMRHRLWFGRTDWQDCGEWRRVR